VWVKCGIANVKKDEHAEQLEAFTGPEEVDSCAVSIWEWYLDLRSITLNYAQERQLPTCTKEKHTDVIDGLSSRQLEGGLGFVDLL
jgi:hypothetical protein